MNFEVGRLVRVPTDDGSVLLAPDPPIRMSNGDHCHLNGDTYIVERSETCSES